uniref:Uncharacterized protein n=1 Tax=Chromera velia CCMP2878 TaxID=1169474 RepID=A0A0G4FJ97_9ALVE|eukprot:Cvel_17314.t1-p1 / transcript=Cvel_17314.t1 / gene=Cvel_17314 / organism=Chromera_velia_CCMP2878 / gene_product=hypothetical protein / transcript_product=hypothetical protein / location=Cvel_scaffold1375:16244-16834(-) / protein_length=197 / sequence_SO=supercontig / SO=protein_coding / is_pseudo=false
MSAALAVGRPDVVMRVWKWIEMLMRAAGGPIPLPLTREEHEDRFKLSVLNSLKGERVFCPLDMAMVKGGLPFLRWVRETFSPLLAPHNFLRALAGLTAQEAVADPDSVLWLARQLREAAEVGVKSANEALRLLPVSEVWYERDAADLWSFGPLCIAAGWGDVALLQSLYSLLMESHDPQVIAQKSAYGVHLAVALRR